MSLHFLDTSALAKLYHREDGTERMHALRKEARSPFRISEYTTVELYSALARKAREGVFTRGDLDRLLSLFEGHLRRGVYDIVPFGTVVRSHAQDLFRHHGTTTSFRALDAIQLATVLHLRSRHPGDAVTIITSDRRLADLASRVGVTVLNPVAA